jgi:hypothetical protein
MLQEVGGRRNSLVTTWVLYGCYKGVTSAAEPRPPSRPRRRPNVTVVLQWCYSGVTVVLQWCYSGVTVVLQWCYSVVTVV